jgi:hypothetical protein
VRKQNDAAADTDDKPGEGGAAERGTGGNQREADADPESRPILAPGGGHGHDRTEGEK